MCSIDTRAPAVKRLVNKNPEFPTVTPHDLRHTAASLAISAGANVKAVQTMLGHASAVLTLGHLRRLVPGRLGVGFGCTRRRSNAIVEICCGPAADWNARRPRPDRPVRTSH